LPFRRERRWRTNNHDGIGAEAYQLCCKFIIRLGLALREPVFDREVLTLDIAKVAEPPAQRLNEVGLGGRREIAEMRHLCWLLCPRRERPSGCRTTEKHDELAPFHYSITSSAVCRNGSGMVRPSAFAVLRLMTSSYLVGCWTGRSLGFAPLRIRTT